MLMVARMSDETNEEALKKDQPEKWALAGYLRDNIRDSAIGLVVTFTGLLFELSKLSLVV